MASFTSASFAARIDELRRDWPLLIADDNIGQWLSSELGDHPFDDVFADFIAALSIVVE